MCGISCIISRSDNSIDHAELKKITNLVSHRGPDGEGYFYGENFAFGHRRLSIIDLSDQANQPMIYMEDFVITFNGAIYNYIELRAELQVLGYKFNSDSDTEVILAAYVHWGKECIKRFNGMWSFSIYDKKKNILFCSRDRFGVKPFYYYSDDEVFVFGSEIRQLLPFLKERKVNKQILTDFLVTGALEHTDETFFENIKKLPASNNLIYDLTSHKFEIVSFYQIPVKDKSPKSFDKANEEIQTNLEKSIKLRLRSDVRIGSCLSGGIDSSTVVALAADKYNSESPFKVFHAQSTEAENDESLYARQLSTDLNLELQILKPISEDFINNLEKVIEIQEEPFGGPAIYMQYFIFEQAKNSGIKVMLDGQGGDETLLGYEKYFPAYFREILKRKGVFAMCKEIYNANRNNDKMSFKETLKFIIGISSPSIRKSAYRHRAFFMKEYKNDFYYLKEFAGSYGDIKSLQKLEIEKTMLPELLRYEDKNSMYNSIESRLPYLDYTFVEKAVNLRTEFKINQGWTKYILRRILSDLNFEKIAWRRKKNNFNAPTETWLSELKSTMIDEISKSEIIKSIANFDLLISKFDKINLITKWRLFNIAIWERIFKVK